MAYPGGKSGSGVYQTIINHMPPHSVYIEGFLGGGAILRLKRPAPESIAIDVDGDVIQNFDGTGIPRLQLIQADTLEWLASNPVSDDTLIYLDPPYLMETRSSQRPIYRYEFSRSQHVQLLELVQRLPCMVMLSGYYSELYQQALAGWRSVQFTAVTRSGRPAVEWLWMNFPPSLELHDYRYLGRTFRERERIKRRQKRWYNRLLKMPDQERHALLAVIQQLRSTIAQSGDTTR